MRNDPQRQLGGPLNNAVIVLIALVGSAACYQIARASTDDVKVLLSDAQYALNRYQELEIGVVCDSWRAPNDLQALCKQEKRLIDKNVERMKPVLARASRAISPTSVDLLDIYDELHEVAGRLDELSNNVADFAGQDGSRFAQAGGKTLLLSGKFYLVLRARLERDCSR